MTVATTRYGFQTAPWDTPLSMGVQAFIEYNGYILNDRHQSDLIRVISITGLDDNDISDSREVVPGDDGETVYDSWNRGRTFVLTGNIEAGSLGSLMRLVRDLRAAFGSLSESPMKFRWFDIYDSFDDPQTLQNYTLESGSSAPLIVSGGILRLTSAQTFMLLRSTDARLWADSVISLRAIVGSVDSSQVFVVPALKDANDYVSVGYSPTGGLTVTVVSAGTPHVLATTAVSGIVQGQSVWLRGRKDGDLITAELWTKPPSDTTLPSYIASAWLTGADADALGDQVLTLAGFGATTDTANWAVDDFQISSICPADISFNAKKLSSLSIKDQQSSPSRFTRPFQITMRAGQPHAKCATQSRSQILVPSSGNSTELGFSAPLRAPLSARNFVPGTVTLENSILSLCNRGTAPERPIIVFYGASTGFLIANLDNGMQLNWNGTLADGDYLVFDCQRRTLVNSAGVNQRAYLSYSDYRWMLLEPQWNDLYVAGSGYSANTKVLAYYRGRWK